MEVLQTSQFNNNPYVQRIYEESEQIRISLGASTIDEALSIINKRLQEQGQE